MPARLVWRTGLAGCLLPVARFGMALFFYWRRHPGAVIETDSGEGLAFAAAA